MKWNCFCFFLLFLIFFVCFFEVLYVLFYFILCFLFFALMCILLVFQYLFDFLQHFKDSEIPNKNYKNGKTYDNKESHIHYSRQHRSDTNIFKHLPNNRTISIKEFLWPRRLISQQCANMYDQQSAKQSTYDSKSAINFFIRRPHSGCQQENYKIHRTWD